MISDKNTAKIVGALFLTAIITDTIGSELIESLLEAPDYLTAVSANRAKIIIGVLLDLICCAAVVGIPVMMYPVFKQYNKNIALGYLGLRLIEPAIMIVILISSLSVLTLSQEFVKTGMQNISYYQTMGALLKSQRYWGYLIYITVFGFGASVFYYALYQTKLVPRFIAIWGLGGVIIILAGAVCDMFGYSIDMAIYGTPMGLNELFLGIWLIAKGFNSPQNSQSLKSIN